MRRLKPNEKALQPVIPNVGIEMEYKRILKAMIKQMHDSVMYWLEASYKKNEPVIAQDATPAVQLQIAVRKLARRWQRNFNRAAPALAEYFTDDVGKRSDARLKQILKDAGFSVKFQMTAGQKDVIKATVNQNVALIKSIPQKYMSDVEGAVMRSVQSGRDLAQLAQELQATYGITKRRAAAIALDQNNKATAALTRARQIEFGISEAIWKHSHAGKVPRPKHLAADGARYDVRKGMKIGDKGQWVQPGEEINCRCRSQPIVAGFI